MGNRTIQVSGYPPPLTYVSPLLAGLTLDRWVHVPFLPGCVARSLGWSVARGRRGTAHRVVFQTMRGADAPVRSDKSMPRLSKEGHSDIPATLATLPWP